MAEDGLKKILELLEKKRGNKLKMKVGVNLPSDEKGFTGRECPQCGGYFKVNFGTGLHGSSHWCPYCGFSGSQRAFVTKDQFEYAKSIAVRKFTEEVVEPFVQELEQGFRELERATRDGIIQIKVKSTGSPRRIPLNTYQEKEVETYVKCDQCGLEFAVYGVFANCPDCRKLNASIVFRKSIEAAYKRIKLIDLAQNDPELHDLQNPILEDALSGGVSAFDGLGKALQKHYPTMVPDKPKNLFQNLEKLSKSLSKSIGKSLSDIVGRKDFDLLWKMFQVRHIFEHNMGVIDADFIRNVPEFSHLKGRKYSLEQEEIDKFLSCILQTGNKILEILERA